MGNKFQDGFASLTVRGIPLSQAYPGKIWWVNGSSVIPKDGIGGVDDAGAGTRSGTGSYKRPFATIAYAISKVTTGRGDIIAVMPGYSQNIDASDLTFSTAGVALVGLGTGSLRPQLTMTATGSLFAVTAPNAAIIGFDFISNVSDNVTLVSIAAAALGTSFESCNFLETNQGNNLNYKAAITLTTAAHDQSFINCTFIAEDVLMASFIKGASHDRLYIENCRFFQHATQSSLVALIVGTTLTSGLIRDCSFRSKAQNAKFLGFSSTSTGVTWGCSFSSEDTVAATGNADTPYVTSGFHCHNCYVSGEQDAWGIIGGGTAVGA